MPRTRLHKDESNNQDVFANFVPPTTTDGSYMGTMEKRNAAKEHLKTEFDAEFKRTRERLRNANTKVGICLQGTSIALQATLPLRPGVKDKNGTGTNQTKISLGIPANLEGLRTAEEEAYILGALMARGQFVWNDKYLGKKAARKELKTVGDLMVDFEKKYFQTRKRTEQSELTYEDNCRFIKSNVPMDLVINADNLLDALQDIEHRSVRVKTKSALSVLCGCFGINIDFKRFKITSGTPSRKRYIASDEEVEFYYEKYEQYISRRQIPNSEDMDMWMMWRWMYGMMAAYGVRPHELLTNPDFDWWLSEANTDDTWKVSANTKTGEREVFPLHRRWIETFDLKNKYCADLVKIHVIGKNLKQIRVTSVKLCARWFRFLKFPFTQYDLRHTWAIRAHLNGISIKAAADNMGHTVLVHTQTYQRYFDRDMRKQMMTQAVNRVENEKALQEENRILRAENRELIIQLERAKAENETLREMLQAANGRARVSADSN